MFGQPVCMPVCMYVYVFVCVFVCLYVCMYTDLSECGCTAYTSIYVCAAVMRPILRIACCNFEEESFGVISCTVAFVV